MQYALPETLLEVTLAEMNAEALVNTVLPV